MEKGNIFFKIKYKKQSRSSNSSVILLEPLFENDLLDYQYDIGLLKKDFSVYEISEDLHFVYESDVKDFFIKHSETKIGEIPTRLLHLNYAAEELSITR